MDYPIRYDVIVVGCGNAGAEASLASARMGCKTHGADQTGSAHA